MLRHMVRKPLKSTFGRLNLYRTSAEEPSPMLRLLELSPATLLKMFEMEDADQWWQLCRALPPEEQSLVQNILDQMSFENISEVEDMFATLESATGEVFRKIRTAMSALADTGVDNIEVHLSKSEIHTLAKFAFASEMRHASIFDMYVGREKRVGWLYTLRAILRASHEELSKMDVSFPRNLTDANSVSYRDIAEKRFYIWRAPKGKEFLLLQSVVFWEYSWTNEAPGKFESSHIYVTLSPEVILVFCSPSYCHRCALHGAQHQEPKPYTIPAKWKPGSKRYLQEERKGLTTYHITPLRWEDYISINKFALISDTIVCRDPSTLNEVEKNIFSETFLEQMIQYHERYIVEGTVSGKWIGSNVQNLNPVEEETELHQKPCATKLYLNKYQCCPKAYAYTAKCLLSGMQDGVNEEYPLPSVLKGGFFPASVLSGEEVLDGDFCQKFKCLFKVNQALLETHCGGQDLRPYPSTLETGMDQGDTYLRRENLAAGETMSQQPLTRISSLLLDLVVPSVVIICYLATTFKFLYFLVRLGRLVPGLRWLGLLLCVLHVTVRAALGEDVSTAWMRAYQYQRFNRFQLLVFIWVFAPTVFAAYYFTFTSWTTAVMGFSAIVFIEQLTAFLRHALEWLNIDINTIRATDLLRT